MRNKIKHSKSLSLASNKLRRNRRSVFIDLFKEIYKYGWLLVWLLGNRETRRSALILVERIRSLYKGNGSLFTVMYLKEAHRLTMKALSGNPEVCKLPLRVSSRRGLPLIIPGDLRLLMENKIANPEVVRLVLSILTVYRVIRTVPQLKLSTITSPFTGIYREIAGEEVKHLYVKYFENLVPKVPETFWIWRLNNFKFEQGGNLLPLTTAGPNVRVSLVGAVLDCIAFLDSPNLLASLKTVMKYTGKNLSKLFDDEAAYVETFKSKMQSSSQKRLLSDLKLGRLAEKLEAAGKVRVFAIADVWTQSALKPFHKYLMSILKNIPQDGTFNQLLPLRNLMKKGIKEIFSYDLSSATDRLPIDLQVQIITLIMGEEFASAWKVLLTSRPWYHKGVPLVYSVGQPMGAYSSWPSLALTHHFIVQLAAMRSGYDRWFEDYAVLGDDIVIGDKVVARVYLGIMRGLGVEVNLSKSLESSIGLAEFAKRLLDDQQEYSPVGARNVLNVIRDVKELPALWRDVISKEGEVARSPSVIKELFDSFPKELSLKGMGENLLWSIVGPLGFVRGGIAPFMETWTETNSLSPSDSKSFLEAFDYVLNLLVIQQYYHVKEHNYKVYQEMLRGHGGQYYTHEGWIKINSQSWFSRLPIEGLPSTSNITAQIVPKLFDVIRPLDVTYRDSLHDLHLDQVYDYVQKRLTELDGYIPYDSPYAFETRGESPPANRFVIYKLVATRLWEIDRDCCLRVVRWSQKPSDSPE